MKPIQPDNGSAAAVFGLVLAGGRSRRMERDKAGLEFDGRTQLDRAFELLDCVCDRAFVSVRDDQRDDPTRSRYPQIVDRHADVGPLAGILAAQEMRPDAAWLVLACDLPLVTARTLEHLLEKRDPAAFATAYRSSRDGLPEPLCAVFEPHSRKPLLEFLEADVRCPRKILIRSRTRLLEPLDERALDNVNTQADLDSVLDTLAAHAGDRP